MRFARSYSDFFDNTKMIFDFFRLRSMGLEPDSFLGTFFPNKMTEVLDFCSQHPDFHIVSAVAGGLLVNRYDARGTVFQLAEGDASPDYVYHLGPEGQWTFGGDKAFFVYDAG